MRAGGGPAVEAGSDGPSENRAALDGAEGAMGRAAACAAILLHAARGVEPIAGAAEARRVLASGEARAVAARWSEL